MKTENFEAIKKGLECNQELLKVLIESGDRDRAKEIAADLLDAKVALYNEKGELV